MIDEKGHLIQRTSNAAMTCHMVADKLDEIARRMILLYNATAKREWTTVELGAFRTLVERRRRALNELKKLGEEK